MGSRKKTAWRLIERPGTGVKQVDFRHAGQRYRESTGCRDTAAAEVEAARIYSEIVSGRRAAKQQSKARRVGGQGLDVLFAEWLASLEGMLDKTAPATATATATAPAPATAIRPMRTTTDPQTALRPGGYVGRIHGRRASDRDGRWWVMSESTVSSQCNSCGGYGLYSGMAERNGDAVVCSQCKGTGLYTIKYIPFNGRQEPRSTILRVFQANPGIVTAPGATSGGVTLAEWIADPSSPKQRGKEMRSHTCPRWWYQCADYSKCPDWKECDESLGRTFLRCPSFANKSECWARFDRETVA